MIFLNILTLNERNIIEMIIISVEGINCILVK